MDKKKNRQMIQKLMLSLLPIQVLLAVTGALSSFISGYFASNFVGIDAMSAVGLFAPINMLIGAVGTIIAGGSAIICGKYLGANQKNKLHQVFSLDLMLAFIVSLLLTLVFGMMGLLGSGSLFTRDEIVRPVFDRYLLGQSFGIIPRVLTYQLPIFLSMESQSKRSLGSSIVYIILNGILNFVFVQFLHTEEMGLALANSISLWILFIIQLDYFMSERSMLRFALWLIDWKRIPEIIKVGFPGAATYIYQTLRGLIVNGLLESYIGSIAISAFATSNNIMSLFWAIPTGMQAVSRLLITVSVGEEDRETLCNIMRIVFTRYIPIMLGVDLCIFLLADPLTSLFYRDAASEVFRMSADGLRILPWCMPLSIVLMVFISYYQSVGKTLLINFLSILDGVFDVVLFSWLLISSMGINGVYWANIFNGVVTTFVIILHACIADRKIPVNMEELLAIPKDLGVDEDNRIDISVSSMEDVVSVSRSVQEFCRQKGIDEKRSYLAGLATEEMAGNVIDHGFVKDNKEHNIDIRVTYKDDSVLLRIKDDCVPFDPKTRSEITDPSDPTKNIGVRMIYKIMHDIDYQNILGLNVLTIRV